jgi:multiple sugar transport system substrate-binding protein
MGRSLTGWLAALAPVAALLSLAGCGGSSSSRGPAALNWYVFKDKSGAYAEIAKTCSQQSAGRYRINIQLLPADADGQRQQLVRRLAAKDSSIDLLGMDVIWTGEFAEAKWIKPFAPATRAQISKDIFAAPLETASYRGKLYGAPFNTNVQILFYRRDLVPRPPTTWGEMIAAASRLPKSRYVEVQGAQYEGYTVWFNTMVNSAGGTILAGLEKAALGEPAVRALSVMKQLATSAAADPSLSNAMEDQTSAAYSGGKAAFMLNYPDFYGTTQMESKAVFDKTAIAPYPGIDAARPSRPTIGGINIGVGAFGKHKAQAAAAATCMSSRPSQKILAVKGRYAISNATLYGDPAVLRAEPFAPVVRTSLLRASLRPVTPAYNDISLAIQKTLSPPSAINPRSSAKELKAKIDKALKSGGLL